MSAGRSKKSNIKKSKIKESKKRKVRMEKRIVCHRKSCEDMWVWQVRKCF